MIRTAFFRRLASLVFLAAGIFAFSAVTSTPNYAADGGPGVEVGTPWE